MKIRNRNITLNVPIVNGDVLNSVTGGGGTGNTFVNSFVYNDANKFTVTRNDAVSLDASFDSVTGLTVNGNLLVTGTTNISGITSINSSLDVSNGTIGLRTNDYFLQGTNTGGTNVQIIGVSSSDEIVIGNQGYVNRIMDDTIVKGELDILSGLTLSYTPTNNDSLTEILGRNSSTGEIEYKTASSFGGGGGSTVAEPYIDNSFVSTLELTGQESTFNTNINSYNGFASCSPFFIGSDVVISQIAIEQTNATSSGTTAKLGIYKYVQNAGAYTPNYEFTKVYQLPTDVNAAITGVQTFTLSPTLTLTGGSVYAAIIVHDTPSLAAGSADKPTYFGPRQLTINGIIGRNPSSVTVFGRTLETTTNATITGGQIASTINFNTIGQGNFSAFPYIYFDMKNV
jgi:hypothetical protein